MKDLQDRFDGRGQTKGFRFSQIRKTDKGFIYLVDTGDTKYYEVFKRKENTMYNCVSYPTDKAFGIWAWTIKDYDSALEKLNSFLL